MNNLKNKSQNKIISKTTDLQPLTTHPPELMAPAGDWTMLRTAVQGGANAVYFGFDKLNMSAKAANFKVDDLPDVVKFC